MIFEVLGTDTRMHEQKDRLREMQGPTGNLLNGSHATGEAFIGPEKFSVIMASGLGLRNVHLIISYQNENFFASKFF